ncbi:hypothetical protein HDU99_003849, partial [Rhizoclosmatium hyalinum]
MKSVLDGMFRRVRSNPKFKEYDLRNVDHTSVEWNSLFQNVCSDLGYGAYRSPLMLWLNP